MDEIYFKKNSEWYNWLLNNHNSSKGIWLIFYKKHTGRPSISYENAVEEALCFGWIDSLIKKLDEDKYVRKFTPRTDTNKWSELNIKRMNKLIREGRMRAEGLVKISPEILARMPLKKSTKLVIPDYIKESLKQNPQADRNFSALPPSQKKRYVSWIGSAKQQKTKLRHLQEAIEKLMRNERLGMK